MAKIDGDGDAQLGRLEIARCKLSWGGLMVLLRGEYFLHDLRQVFAVDKIFAGLAGLLGMTGLPMKRLHNLL